MRRLPLCRNLITFQGERSVLQQSVVKRISKRHNKGNETAKVPKAAYTEKDFEETFYNNLEITIRWRYLFMNSFRKRVRVLITLDNKALAGGGKSHKTGF